MADTSAAVAMKNLTLGCPQCRKRVGPCPLGRMNMADPQALRNPRPDNAINASRRLGSFDPVGGGVTPLGSRTVGLDITGEVGTVKVVIG